MALFSCEVHQCNNCENKCKGIRDVKDHITEIKFPGGYEIIQMKSVTRAITLIQFKSKMLLDIYTCFPLYSRDTCANFHQLFPETIFLEGKIYMYRFEKHVLSSQDGWWPMMVAEIFCSA